MTLLGVDLHRTMADAPDPTPFERLTQLVRGAKTSYSATPFFGVAAAVCAMLDVVWNRIAVRAIDEPFVLAMSRVGDLPRNLAGVFGIVALALGIFRFLIDDEHVRVRRRLGLAAFSGIFVPTAALAVVLPAQLLTSEVLLIGAAAAYVLVVLLALTAAVQPVPIGYRTASLLAALGAFGAFIGMAALLIRPLAVTRIGHLVATLCEHGSEVCYFLVPLAVLPVLVPRIPDVRSWLGVGLAIAAGVAVGGSLAIMQLFSASPDVVLVGAFDVELLVDVAPFVYPILFGVGFGAAALGIFHRSAIEQQIGVGLVLWLAAGSSGRVPIRLLAMVLGMVLLTRAAIALGERVTAALSTSAAAQPPVSSDSSAASALATERSNSTSTT
jgi:hypothetical protein